MNANASIASVYDTGTFGSDHGIFLRGSVELDWKLTKHLIMVLPQMNYFVPVTVHDSRSLDGAVFGGFSYQF